MSHEVTEIATPALVSETAVGDGVIELRLVGSAEGDTLGDLTELLAAVHRVALERRTGEVIFDVRALDFASAASLRAILAWVSQIRRGRAYGVRFVANDRAGWQRRSLEGIVAFGGDLVRVQ